MTQHKALCCINLKGLQTILNRLKIRSKTFTQAAERYNNYLARKRDSKNQKEVDTELRMIITTFDNLDIYLGYYEEYHGQNKMRRLRKKHLHLPYLQQKSMLKKLVRTREGYMRGFLTMIMKAAHERKYFKELADRARGDAMKASSPRTIERRFYASTLARALMPHIPERDKRNSIKEAIETWKVARPMRQETVTRVVNKVKNLLTRFGTERRIPDPPETLPASKACLELPVADGGAMRDMLQIGRTMAEEMGMTLEELPMLLGESTIAAACRAIAGNMGGFGLRDLTPVAITALGGKIRVITKHPAAQVTLARHVTNTWIKIVALLRPCKVIEGSGVILYRMNSHSSSIPVAFFSADLSKATDYINHSLAFNMAMMFMEHHWPGHWMNAEVCKMFGYKKITGLPVDGVPAWWAEYYGKRNGEVTSSGIHMGLGTTWTILSLVNVGCALAAGAKISSFAVCGDDLIGWWPEDVKDRYIRTLEDCGLVVNKSKSYWSSSTGVFCEGFVRKESETRASVVWKTKMSEFYSSQWRNFQTGTILSAAAGAPKGAPIRKIFKGLPRGPTSLGMGGKLPTTRLWLRRAFARGTKPLAFTHNYDDASRAIKKATMKVGQRKSGDHDTDVLLPWLTRFAKEQRLRHALEKDGKGFNRFVNGEVRHLTLKNFRTLDRQPKNRTGWANIPKRIRLLIQRRPWRALKVLEKHFSKTTIRLSDLPEELREATVQRNSGLAVKLCDVIAPRSKVRENEQTLGVVHPLLTRFQKPDV